MRSSVWAFGLTLIFMNAARANPRLGDVAPPINLRTPNGAPVQLDVHANRVVVVDFFATWCGPCKQAISALHTLLPPLADRVSLMVVDVGESPATVRAYLAAHPMPAGTQVVIDPDGQVARQWGQDRFPTTFLLDGHGIIRHINRGYGPGYAARVTAWIETMARDLLPVSSSDSQ